MARTNVPEEIRSIWTDLYVHFDKYYLMENTDENWKRFWNEGEQIYMKHNQSMFVTDVLGSMSVLISERMRKEMMADGR